MRKRALCFILCLCMVTSVLTGVGPFNGFIKTAHAAEAAKDIDGHWSASAIETCRTYGVMSGDTLGYYRPDAPITRAEFSAMVNRAFGYTALNAPELTDYTDIPASKWYSHDMKTAIALRYIQGYGNGIAAPEYHITREQAAVILNKILRLRPSSDTVTQFTDMDGVSSWAVDAVLTMEQSGYIVGSNGRFMPKSNITRGEAAQLLSNIFGVIVDDNLDAGGKTYNNVTIRKPGVSLKNAKITGDLFITEGVRDGDVWLDTVHIGGRLLAAGGGENSIYVKDVEVGENVVVDKPLVAGIQAVRFRAAESKDTLIIFEGTVREVIISEDLMIICHNDGEITVFNFFKPDGGQAKPTLNISENAVVEKITIISPAIIDGKGEAGKIEVRSDGVEISSDVNVNTDNIEVDKGIEVNVGDKIITGTESTPSPTPSTGGGSGGGSSGGSGGGSSGGGSSGGGSGPSKPTLSGTATITGNVEMGQTVGVDTSKITGGSGAFSYEWKVNGVTVGTDETYTVLSSDAGKAVTCVITRSDISGSVTTSAITVPFNIQIINFGNDTIDTEVTLSANKGAPGQRITLSYALGDNNTYNKLMFSGGTGLTDVVSAGDSTSQAYTVNANDAVNGVITIHATFAHTSSKPLVIGIIPEPDKILSPIEATANFKVTAKGFDLDSDANGVGLSFTNVTGLNFSGHDTAGNATNGIKTFNITVTYDGTSTITDVASSIKVTGVTNATGYTYAGDPKTANVNIYDGQAEARAIPVKQSNVLAFNTYANASAASSLTRYYKQIEDISLSGSWTPVGGYNGASFRGGYDGDNYTISNLNISNSSDGQGFFGVTNAGSEIKNVRLTNASISAGGWSGGVVGEGYGNITNCHVEGSISGSKNSIGGIVGYNSGGTIKGCTSDVVIIGTGNLNGGIVGWSNGTIDGCTAEGSVSGADRVGGVLGSNGGGTVKDCSSDIIVTATGNWIGGVVGWSNNAIENCTAEGNVSGTEDVGGVVGRNYGGTVTDCRSISNEIDGVSKIGGVAGYNSGALEDCTSSGEVSITGTGSMGGGVVGHNDNGTVSACSATGNVKGIGTDNSTLGGVVGNTDGGTIESCYSEGNIDGYAFIGGVAGSNNSGTISKCYATGDVTGTDQQVGGVAGYNVDGGIIQSCYSAGTVRGGGEMVGGVVGYNGIISISNNGKVENCYSTGDVYGGDKHVGGIVGLNNANVQYCYATGNVTGANLVGGITGESTYPNKNCAALSQQVELLGAYNNIGRVFGSIVDGSSNYASNYAHDGMVVITGGTYTPAKAHNSKDGADISSAEWNAESWWTTAGNWNNAAWDTTVWNITNGSLPTLKNMPDNPEQNPIAPNSFMLPTSLGNLAAVTVTANGSALVSITGTEGGYCFVGDTVTITATPDEGWVFGHWEDEDGETVSYDAKYSFNVAGDVTLIAICVEDTPVEPFDLVQAVEDYDIIPKEGDSEPKEE